MSVRKSLNYQHVMSRMEWFRDLKLIFNKLTGEEDVLRTVNKAILIKELGVRAAKLELKSPEEYHTDTKVQAFSLAEILAHVDSLESSFNFDQLIDSLIYLSMRKKGSEVVSQESTERVRGVVKSFSLSKPESLTPSFRDTPSPSAFLSSKRNQPIKIHCPEKSPILDHNFPSNPLKAYPDLKNYEKLLHLYLAGNSINHTNFPFPQSIITLNLSCNRISELKFVHELLSLNVLNVTSNQICRILNINYVKNVQEIFIANNCIASANLFSSLGELRLLDCSHNEIESFEDVARLGMSKKLGILKLRGNPIGAKEGYERVVERILPRIYNFDPVNLVDYSNFKKLGLSVFLPMKDMIEEKERKDVKEKSQMIGNKSAKSITPTKKTTSNTSPCTVLKSQKLLSSKTPIPSSNHQSLQRSNSHLRLETSKILTSTTRTSLYSNDTEEIPNPQLSHIPSSNMIDIAERRIKVFKPEMKHNVSVISNESIKNLKKKVYGNPVAAMMIGPPAASQSKPRLSKTPCFSVDLSRNRRK